MLDLTYVLPIRSSEPPDDDLTAYVRRVAAITDVVVVDGSEPAVFDAAHAAWSEWAEHVAPDADLGFANGKVNGVLTGLRRSRHDKVVIADDDVRYDEIALRRLSVLLDGADLVRPQNHFDPLPLHARWDTARTLVNRAVGHDFPGTLAVRRSILDRTGGYDGDVLFENLELMRTVDAAGGRIHDALDLYVARRPAPFPHFLRQRVRQAYEEMARPVSFALALAVLPLLAASRRRGRAVAMLTAGSVVVAERGRRRAGGAAVFPSSASLMAPLWLLERSICTWLALGARARGGCRYCGQRILTAASSRRTLRAAVAARQRESTPADGGTAHIRSNGSPPPDRRRRRPDRRRERPRLVDASR